MATLSEMAFASHAGLEIDLSEISQSGDHADIIKALFNQEAGIVVQIQSGERDHVI